VKRRAIGVILGTLLPVVTWAAAPWVNDQTVQQQLAAGQVAVRIVFDGDESHMRVHAAVRIHASPEVVWGVLTDCDHAATFIPGVKRCRRVQSAPDGSWELIEQEAKYSWLMPSVTCVVRADYKSPRRIDFKRVSGDLKEEEGAWVLEPEPHEGGGDTATRASVLVEYDLDVDPGFWIPKVLLRHSLRTELPAALAAVRTRSESKAAAER
jgi:uncharacterized protein YndB with AHSA1/START domain